MNTSTPVLRASFIFFLFLVCSSAYTQDSTICFLRDPDGRIREHNVDFIKMVLDVKFKEKEGKVIGNVKYDFKPIQFVVDTLFLNAPGIDIKKVLLDGKETPFTTDSFGVTIKFLQGMNWNNQYKLEISYEATPRKGLYFIGWNVDDKNVDNDFYFTRKQIWTQGQGIDNRHWFPCYDDVNDKMVTETIITFDSAYTVISNGVLKDKKKNTDGTCTWHYAMNKPMVPYLVMIAIDKYGHKDFTSKSGMTSRQYYYSDRPQTAEPTYQYSGEMMDFLVKETGVSYPWETYANIPVQDFMYGAMENTTATVYGDFLLTDARINMERPYIATNAHELTHQWFGDYITEYSPAHHWLHESFATYYSKQFVHKTFGDDAYQWAKRQEGIAAINADRNDRFAIGHSHGGGPRVYPKGSYVIDMIRYTVGDSVYKHCITAYLKKHAYDNVSNNDFMMAFMEGAGVNLDWFFDQWVFHAGFPNYEVKYERLEDKVVFYVSQTHKTDNLTGLFKMPVVFEVHFKDGSSTTKRVWLSHVTDTVYLSGPKGKEVNYTLFDPGSNILKTVNFNKSFEELSSQAEKARNLIDRYDAVVAMRDIDLDKKRDVLIRVFNLKNYNGLQNEIISQLASDKNSASLELFNKALNDSDYTVRRAVVENLSDFPESLVPGIEKMLKDSSYVTIEMALRKLCKLYPSKTSTYLEQTQNIRGVTDNVRMAWLEIASKGNQDSAKYLKPLVDYCSNRYEFRTRVRAMEILEKRGYCNAELIKNLFNASLYTNSRLSNPAIKVLKTFLKNPENMQLAKGVYGLGKWLDWEKKSLEGLLKG